MLNMLSSPPDAPKLPSVSVNPSAEIVEGSSVTLTCSSDANPAAQYTWYKEKQKLLQGQRGIYHFSSISSEDRGNYSCKSENQYEKIMSSSVSVDVHLFKSPPDAPKLPSVSVSPSAEIVEGSSVTLTCSSDANPAANYTWYKENVDSPKASGQIFTITDFRAEHSGNYSCEAQNRRGRNKTTVHLTVAGELLMVVQMLHVLDGMENYRHFFSKRGKYLTSPGDIVGEEALCEFRCFAHQGHQICSWKHFIKQTLFFTMIYSITIITHNKKSLTT
uniref:Ig-like domain-containing protein n=1 Tax=Sparus aurata TaxID=8175 RepID=A0A671TFV6_SPAAU